MLMPFREFLLDVASHKNTVPLSDELIELHKFAIIQEEKLAKIFLKKCTGKHRKQDIASGFKRHLLYHSHSRMAYTRMTPAHSDDQRPENMCKMVKFYLRLYRNQLNKQKARSMAGRVNAEHGICFDQTNTRVK